MRESSFAWRCKIGMLWELLIIAVYLLAVLLSLFHLTGFFKDEGNVVSIVDEGLAICEASLQGGQPSHSHPPSVDTESPQECTYGNITSSSLFDGLSKAKYIDNGVVAADSIFCVALERHPNDEYIRYCVAASALLRCDCHRVVETLGTEWRCAESACLLILAAHTLRDTSLVSHAAKIFAKNSPDVLESEFWADLCERYPNECARSVQAARTELLSEVEKADEEYGVAPIFSMARLAKLELSLALLRGGSVDSSIAVRAVHSPSVIDTALACSRVGLRSSLGCARHSSSELGSALACSRVGLRSSLGCARHSSSELGFCFADSCSARYSSSELGSTLAGSRVALACSRVGLRSSLGCARHSSSKLGSALACSRVGDVSAAGNMLSEVTARMPNLSRPWSYLACVRLMESKKQEALAMAERAVALDPSDPIANELADMLCGEIRESHRVRPLRLQMPLVRAYDTSFRNNTQLVIGLGEYLCPHVSKLIVQ